ncbi:MAG: peptidase U49, Lit peptidase [Proteobacteria bacterium]|nr:peptidase U49, Lit peptidase [Pseudomonadota bacterium]
MTDEPNNRTIVLHLLRGAVPERADDISSLWRKYAPAVDVAASAGGTTMNANRHRIRFDTKTIDLFWLLGFSAWRSIEVYSPALVVSMLLGVTIDQALHIDEKLTTFERDYKERMAAAAALISAASTREMAWPPDIPQPQADRDGFPNPQDKVAFDLTALALAFALLHEFSHVKLLAEKTQPPTLSEEELACDVWARDFMTAKLAAYAQAHNHSYEEVSQKRAMGLALAAVIVHAITPTAAQWGNSEYPPLSDRIQAILGGFNLPSDSWFWFFAACLLVGILRQEHRPLDVVGRTPQALAEALIARVQ